MNKFKLALFRAEQGMVVVLVLLFTTILLFLGSALISYSVSEKMITRYDIQDIKLYYIAEAGAEAALAVLEADYAYNGTLAGSAGEGSYTVSFSTVDSNNRQIISTGSLEGNKRTITVSLERIEGEDEDILIIKKWLNPYTGE